MLYSLKLRFLEFWEWLPVLKRGLPVLFKIYRPGATFSVILAPGPSWLRERLAAPVIHFSQIFHRGYMDFKWNSPLVDSKNIETFTHTISTNCVVISILISGVQILALLCPYSYTIPAMSHETEEGINNILSTPQTFYKRNEVHNGTRSTTLCVSFITFCAISNQIFSSYKHFKCQNLYVVIIILIFL